MRVVTFPFNKDQPLIPQIKENGQIYKKSANSLTSIEVTLTSSDCPNGVPREVYLDDGTRVAVLVGPVARGNMSFGPNPH